MELKKIHFTSKKNNKEYDGYVITIGEYRSPMFFPSHVELTYLKSKCDELGIPYDE